MEKQYAYLDQPLSIGTLTIKNRFCMAPLGGGQHYGPDGGLKNSTIQYFAEGKGRIWINLHRGNRGR